MRRIPQLLIAINILILACMDCRAQSGSNVLTAKIDRLVVELGVTAEEPGLAILVHQAGGVNFVKGYGLANLENKAPITSTTLFELASASKPITATAVLVLHERGKLSLDDDIRKHLTELPDYGTKRPITVRDLLQHISGLPDYMAIQELPSKRDGYWMNSDYLPAFAAQKDSLPLHFQPGAKYEYNNTNYMLAACLVERVSKRPFAEFMRDEIFLPAGMKSTFVCDSPEAKPNEGEVTALGYLKQNDKWEVAWGAPPIRQESLLTAGDGAIWSSVEDFARWDVAVRNGKYFKAATARAALSATQTADGVMNNYGLGWTLSYSGTNLAGFGHDGFWGGFSTSYYFNMLNKRTTIILSNRGSYGGDEFWYKIDAAVDEYLASRKR